MVSIACTGSCGDLALASHCPSIPNPPAPLHVPGKGQQQRLPCSYGASGGQAEILCASLPREEARQSRDGWGSLRASTSPEYLQLYLYDIQRTYVYIYIYRIIYSTQLPKRLKAPTSALTNQDLSTTSIGARVQPLSWMLIHSLRMLLFVLIA